MFRGNFSQKRTKVTNSGQLFAQRVFLSPPVYGGEDGAAGSRQTVLF